MSLTRKNDDVETMDGLLDSLAAEASGESNVARVRVGSQVRELSEAPQNPPRVSEGELLANKYRLVKALGQGGMGSVWVAEYEALDIKVAVKIIRADVQGIPANKLSQRMQQEARAAAKLGHPAIVRITDVGETSAGDAFCVMELLEGEDVGSFLERRGRLSAVKAAQILLPVANALVLAHEKGIVHRDLKPENIFLSKGDEGVIQPKLIDFGIAKMELPKGSERITQGGALMGSPAYMSPEQARGEDVDARSDIWAFSVVLYEMITGRAPFEGKNYHALIRSIIEDKVAPLTNFGVGDDMLGDILDRGLSKNPDERWQTMRQLGGALAGWLTSRGIREDVCGSSISATWLRGRPSEERPSRPPDPFARLSMPEVASRSSRPPPSSVRSGAVRISSGTPLPDVAVATPLPVPKSKTGAFATLGLVAFVASAIVVAYYWRDRDAGRSQAPASTAISAPSATPADAPSAMASAPATVTVPLESAMAAVPTESAPDQSASASSSVSLKGRIPGAAKAAPAGNHGKPEPSAAPTSELTLKRPTF